jgi:hypothetical protein
MEKRDRHASYQAIPPAAFAALGVQQIAYVKPVSAEEEATGLGHGFAIHAADGTPLTVMQSREAAMAAIVQNDMQPLSVH